LIDEYDYPLVNNLTNINIAQANRNVLRNFFSVIKSLDEHLRAIFITGVTKFSKASLFSGLNNLSDITMNPEAAMLLGYTKSEIEHYFAEFVAKYCEDKRLSYQEVMKEMEVWYNGYRFSREDKKVYNPFSILHYLKDQYRANYWFTSGTPSFLVNLLKTQYISLASLCNAQISADDLGAFEIDNIPLVPLLFQAGYLTIHDYNSETGRFMLGYPNYEVEESIQINERILTAYTI
jgi:hypothetical protein